MKYRKEEKALYTCKNREVYKVYKKIKREFASYKVSKEETKQKLKNSPKMNYDNYHDKSKLGWKEQEEFGIEVIKLEEVWKIKKSIAWILIESNLQID